MVILLITILENDDNDDGDDDDDGGGGGGGDDNNIFLTVLRTCTCTCGEYKANSTQPTCKIFCANCKARFNLYHISIRSNLKIVRYIFVRIYERFEQSE